jgi:uncharacterized membrane protein YqgA involved in biofilm formation
MPERFKEILMQALGLSVLLVGLQMSLPTQIPLVAIGCLIAGAVVGEALRIEHWVAELGTWLKSKCGSDSSTFVEGFVTSSLLYVTGAMVVVGSIRDGTMNDPSTLYVKALLDGVASVALASSLGIGAVFSALLLQEPQVLAGLNATGGLLITAIGLNLMGVGNIRIGNMIPGVLFGMIAGYFMI